MVARRRIAAPPEAVFAWLSDLDRHWRLLGGWADVDVLGEGALVHLRGPLGIRRTARTRLFMPLPPQRIEGEALVGRGTAARIRWTLAADRDGTLVTLEAEVMRAGLTDRAALALGGRAWLAARFADALERLDAELAP